MGASTSSEQQCPQLTMNSKPSRTTTTTVSSSSTYFSSPGTRNSIEIIAQALQAAALAKSKKQATAMQNGEVQSPINTASSNESSEESSSSDAESEKEQAMTEPSPLKRGRGRPRKIPNSAPVTPARKKAVAPPTSTLLTPLPKRAKSEKEQLVVKPSPKRRRGRPRKIPNSAPVTPVGKKPVAPPTSNSLTPLPKRVSKPPARLQQMEQKGRNMLSRRRGRGCGNCPGCVRDDCGKCAYCKDKPKFGGPGRKKQRCVLRICSNFHSAPGVKAKHILSAPLGSPVKPVTTGVSSIVKATLMDIPHAPPVPKLVASSSSSSSTPTPSTSTTPTITPITSNLKTEPKMMKCFQFGREEKQTITHRFYTQRCLLQWLRADKTFGDAISEEAGASTTPGTNPLSPPILAPSPKPLPSTTAITTKKPAQAGGGPSKKTPVSSTESMLAGTKRSSSTLQPPVLKKPKVLPQDIRKWSIDQVVKYFQGTDDCAEYADIFLEQEVDGTALLLLSHESLVECLGLKLGRALKIMVHVDELRKEYEQLDK